MLHPVINNYMMYVNSVMRFLEIIKSTINE